MLYGFRSELAESLAREGNHFCIYVPYGDDWFSYFMRRLAERPQNLNLMFLEIMKPEVLKNGSSRWSSVNYWSIKCMAIQKLKNKNFMVKMYVI